MVYDRRPDAQDALGLVCHLDDVLFQAIGGFRSIVERRTWAAGSTGRRRGQRTGLLREKWTAPRSWSTWR